MCIFIPRFFRFQKPRGGKLISDVPEGIMRSACDLQTAVIAEILSIAGAPGDGRADLYALLFGQHKDSVNRYQPNSKASADNKYCDYNFIVTDTGDIPAKRTSQLKADCIAGSSARTTHHMQAIEMDARVIIGFSSPHDKRQAEEESRLENDI